MLLFHSLKISDVTAPVIALIFKMEASVTSFKLNTFKLFTVTNYPS